MELRDLKKFFQIRVIDTLGAEHEYEPQDDITAHELAYITQAFVLMIAALRVPGMQQPPIWEWITAHKLDRHFPPTVNIALPN